MTMEKLRASHKPVPGRKSAALPAAAWDSPTKHQLGDGLFIFNSWMRDPSGVFRYEVFCFSHRMRAPSYQ
jgi:hypothetical protein